MTPTADHAGNRTGDMGAGAIAVRSALLDAFGLRDGRNEDEQRDNSEFLHNFPRSSPTDPVG